MRLNGKVALVTRAASGIGQGIAEAFANAGAAVTIADLNLQGAQNAAEAIKAKGGNALAVAMDVADEARTWITHRLGSHVNRH